MTTSHLNGLEFFNALKTGQIAGSAMSQIIPMTLRTVKLGYVEYDIQPDDRHLNLQGGIHGGFSATVLDSATGAAVHTKMDAGVKFATIDLNVKMLKAMQSGQHYIAIGEVIRTGRTLLTAEARIVDYHGEVYAFGSASLLITHRPE